MCVVVVIVGVSSGVVGDVGVVGDCVCVAGAVTADVVAVYYAAGACGIVVGWYRCGCC